MSFRSAGQRGSVLFLSSCLFGAVNADEVGSSLSLVPDRCVSLHKGQVCYQNVTLEWRSPLATDVCVYEGSVAEPLRCWKSTEEGVLRFDFQSSSPINYVLREEGGAVPLAITTMNIAWVYKAPKSSHRTWRLF